MFQLSDSSRISTIDFFAVLPAGLYIFFLFAACDASLAAAEEQNLWLHLMPLITSISEEPFLIVPVVIAVYLLGSLVRSFKVSWIEFYVRKENRFPYKPALSSFLSALQSVKSSEQLKEDLGNSADPELLYNYWKDRICLMAPNGYNHYIHFEARSRFFAGMVWAGLFGFMLGCFILISSQNTAFLPAWQAIGLSVFVTALFGFQLRGVRETEARVCVALYAALCDQESEIAKRIDGA